MAFIIENKTHQDSSLNQMQLSLILNKDEFAHLKTPINLNLYLLLKFFDLFYFLLSFVSFFYCIEC